MYRRTNLKRTRTGSLQTLTDSACKQAKKSSTWSGLLAGSVRDLKNNLHTARGHDCNKFFKLLNADQSAIKFLIYDPMLIMFQRGWREGGGIDPRREGSKGDGIRPGREKRRKRPPRATQEHFVIFCSVCSP